MKPTSNSSHFSASCRPKKEISRRHWVLFKSMPVKHRKLADVKANHCLLQPLTANEVLRVYARLDDQAQQSIQ
tara:strand:- start:270 stop:488 length:219 start_codon:yes stop_codon:yes gene_type:complete